MIQELVACWESAGLFPPASTVTPLLAYWFRSMRRPKRLGDSLTLQFNGIIVVSPALLSLELRPLGQQSTRLQEQEGKKLLVVSRGDCEWCHSHFHLWIPWPMNPGYGRNITIILNSDSEHIQPSREPYLCPSRYYHLTGSVTESSRSHYTVLSSQPFQSSGEHGRTSELW